MKDSYVWRRMGCGALAFLLFLGAATCGQAQEKFAPPSKERVLQLLRKGHPRLILTPSELDRVKKTIASDKIAAGWYADLKKEATAVLKAAPSEYRIPDGKRLLATSRRVVDRVYLLGLLYRLEPDPRLKDRMWRELDAAAHFKDWNPSHFLDTAEMTHAFAIGYDWLYDQWSAEQRKTLREAIVHMGLEPSLKLYGKDGKEKGWAKNRFNWNTVCNGGIGLGALAILDEEPELCSKIVSFAIGSIPFSMSSFAPDGGWAEGPGYWGYATRYAVPFFAGLDSALGSDFGLSDSPGFNETAFFPIYMTGPTGVSFNYADAHEGPIHGPQMNWLAHRFRLPVAAWFAHRFAEPAPYDLMWYEAGETSPDKAGLPLCKHYRRLEVATLRSSWTDPNALFAGLKAGDNKVGHSHLDLGTFVLDALGERWAIDLAGDDYNLPAYFGNKRWDYYRLRPEGHNTLVIRPSATPGQDSEAETKIVRFDGKAPNPFATADLTPAYAAQARRFERTLKLENGNKVLVEDILETKMPSEVWWFMHTRAKVEVAKDGATARLTQQGKTLEARIISPKGAVFTVMDPVPLSTSPHPEKQNPNKGVKKLAIHLDKVEKTEIRVEFGAVGMK